MSEAVNPNMTPEDWGNNSTPEPMSDAELERFRTLDDGIAAKLVDEVKRLRAENAWVQERVLFVLEASRSAWRGQAERIADLEAGLEKYGVHLLDCPKTMDACICGLSLALKGGIDGTS